MSVGGGHPALGLLSSSEPYELSQWAGHNDSTINIVNGIIVDVIITIISVITPATHC